jgi:hypothetical protein
LRVILGGQNVANANDKIALAIITVVNDNGELPTDEIITTVRALDGFDEIEAKAIDRQIIKLDRDGKLTRQNQTAGWQLTANGRGALDGLRAKMEQRFIAPYTGWRPVEAVLTLLSPSLGPITDPGGQGIGRFPRLDDGRIIVYGGWIRAAMMKAADKGDSTIIIDGAGARRTLPDVAWSRVSVKPCIIPSTITLGRSVRRPTNTRGQSVGEIIHESLPIGTTLRIRASFPSSHFSQMYLVRLFGQLEDMGISAAGAGKGGIWGIGEISSVKIDGQEVWPSAIGVVTPPEKPGRVISRSRDNTQTVTGAVTYVNGASK